jgi:ankyrin repeat protein
VWLVRRILGGLARQHELDRALWRAISGRDLRSVAEVLRSGANVEARKAANEPKTPLIAAADMGDTELTTMLLQHGADPCRTGEGRETPLMVAARRGHLAVLELLLASGADPSARDWKGRTAEDHLCAHHSGRVLQRGLELLRTNRARQP